MSDLPSEFVGHRLQCEDFLEIDRLVGSRLFTCKHNDHGHNQPIGRLTWRWSQCYSPCVCAVVLYWLIVWREDSLLLRRTPSSVWQRLRQR